MEHKINPRKIECSYLICGHNIGGYCSYEANRIIIRSVLDRKNRISLLPECCLMEVFGYRFIMDDTSELLEGVTDIQKQIAPIFMEEFNPRRRETRWIEMGKFVSAFKENSEKEIFDNLKDLEDKGLIRSIEIGGNFYWKSSSYMMRKFIFLTQIVRHPSNLSLPKGIIKNLTYYEIDLRLLDEPFAFLTDFDPRKTSSFGKMSRISGDITDKYGFSTSITFHGEFHTFIITFRDKDKIKRVLTFKWDGFIWNISEEKLGKSHIYKMKDDPKQKIEIGYLETTNFSREKYPEIFELYNAQLINNGHTILKKKNLRGVGLDIKSISVKIFIIEKQIIDSDYVYGVIFIPYSS